MAHSYHFCAKRKVIRVCLRNQDFAERVFLIDFTDLAGLCGAYP